MKPINLQNHFTVLIYPFLHALTDKSGIACPQALPSGWRLRFSQLKEVDAAIDDTFFFLPYVRSLIFPETALLTAARPGVRFAKWREEVQSWERQITADYRAFRARLNPDALLWLRLDDQRLDAIKDFTVIPHSEKNGETSDDQKIAARFHYAETMLFPTGLGLLILKAALTEARPQFSQLIDLNYYLRLVHAPTLDYRLPQLEFAATGKAKSRTTLSVRDLMDFLLQGIVSADCKVEPNPTTYRTLLDATSPPHRYSETDAGQIYGERCHLLSYACLDGQLVESEKGAFDTVEDRWLYEFATCTALGASVGRSAYAPSPDEAKRMMSDNRVFVWNCWRGLALKDNVVFLATEDLAFNRTGLPHNIENDYLPLYLYALYQKYQLFVFAEAMVRKVADIHANLREVRQLADRFTRFRNKYWLNEITRKPLGNELYRKFHVGLETGALYELVSSEVRQIQEYYEAKNDKSIAALLNFLTFVFLPLGAVIGGFGMNFVSGGSWKRFGIAMAVVGALSFASWLIWNHWRRK